MIHTELADKLKKDQQRDNFLYPAYGKTSLIEVVPTIFDIFGVPTKRAKLPEAFYKEKAVNCNKVILLFVDGFGYNPIEQYNKAFPFLDRLVTRGDVYPITSIFPSTTAAGITAINTGFSPQEQGLHEWYVYFEELGHIIQTLPFATIVDEDREVLMQAGGEPSMLYNGQTMYEQLQAAGIPSYAFLNQDYATDIYSQAAQRGATVVPYFRSSDLVVKLRTMVQQIPGPAYFFVYWPELDKVEHRFGPYSQEHLAEMSVFSNLLTNEFLDKLDPAKVQETLLLLTADHGQIAVNPPDLINIYQYPEITGFLAPGKNGSPIAPTGSPRDMFLFIQPDKLDQVASAAKKIFEGRATVMKVAEAVRQNLFGINAPSERFLQRAGNLLILPHGNSLIWYDHRPGHPFSFFGHHGGMTHDEMLIPFGIARISDLLK